MGGQIWIESEGLDKGSIATFVVKLGIYNNPSDPSRNEQTITQGAIPLDVNQSSEIMMG